VACGILVPEFKQQPSRPDAALAERVGYVCVHAIRSKNRAAVVLSLWLSLYPLMYYLTQFSPRYRHPILGATLLPGSYLVVVFLFGIAGKSTSVSAREKSSAAN
jgi:hypothetical protein